MQEWARSGLSHWIGKAIYKAKARKVDSPGSRPQGPRERKARVKSPISKRLWKPRHKFSV